MAKEDETPEHIEASEFNAAGELYACPACCIVFAFEGSSNDECHVCGYQGELDTINL